MRLKKLILQVKCLINLAGGKGSQEFSISNR